MKELATVSLSNPIKVFVNENKDIAFNLQQEFVRIRPHMEADREAIVAGNLNHIHCLDVLVFGRRPVAVNGGVHFYGDCHGAVKRIGVICFLTWAHARRSKPGFGFIVYFVLESFWFIRACFLLLC